MDFPSQYTEDWEMAAFKIPTPVGIMIPTPRTVKDVFKEFIGRRAGLIKALTTDVKEFYKQCDPVEVVFTEKEGLCLFAFPNETWQVKPPNEMVPAELPEPILGINFPRDSLPENDWLKHIALHGDTWLLSFAFHIATCSGFDKIGRKSLFKMINSLPTIAEVVTGTAKEQDNDECEATLCGACGDKSHINEFWICCDECDRSFHLKCVKLTPTKAECIEHYICPSCSNERAEV